MASNTKNMYPDPPKDIRHIHMERMTFGKEDIELIITANMEHIRKYIEMQKENFKRYEMEKKFLERQRLKHIRKEEERRRVEKEMEVERERQVI